MAGITAKMVKELREKTGVGMMHCKSALDEAGGDVQIAHELLRKKGMKTAQKKAGRAANEGSVVVKMSDDGKRAAILGVSCETDFVVKNEKFSTLVEAFATQLLEKPAQTTQEFLARDFGGGTVDSALKDMIGLIGENMAVTAVATLEVDDTGKIGSYIHHNGKLGVILSVTDAGMVDLDCAKVDQLVADLCMQVSFSNPISLDRSGVPQELIEKERDIYKEQVKDKPEQIQDKIIEGMLGKFFKEQCLVDQEFINPAKFKGNIRGLISGVSGSMAVNKYVRVELGG